MTDAICLGELLIDFVPTLTGANLIEVPAFIMAPGGAPGEMAVGLARLRDGARSTLAWGCGMRMAMWGK